MNSELPEPPTFWELARQALSGTRRGYDLLAPKFEATPFATPLHWLEASLARAEARFPLPREQRTRGADLCCGTGRASRVLGEYCQRVVGFDFSEQMLAEADRLVESSPKFRWEQVDFSQQSLPAGGFHRIVTFGAWGHILPEFRSSFLEQIVDHLEPGGSFVTLTADDPCWWQRRYWFQLFFDNAIRLRNLLWFKEFHMYYALNSTGSLVESFKEVLQGRGSEFLLELEPLPRYPNRVVTLLILYRKPLS